MTILPSPRTHHHAALIFLLLLIAMLAGCAGTSAHKAGTLASGQAIPDSVTSVLPAGAVLLAHTAAGRLKIKAGPGGLRTFIWDQAHRSAVVKPRTQPFPGADSVGLHYAGKPPHWPTYKGINKLHYEESTRSFASPVDLKVWTQIRRLYFSYNDRGLAVGWKRDGDTLHVEVWRFQIGGKVPRQLPGADNMAVKLELRGPNPG